MTNEELYEIWAPADARWSLWAKPVLFAQMTPNVPVPNHAASRAIDVSWAPGPAEGAAMVVDLAGAESLQWGLALAERGYRPVPLFNGATGVRTVVPVQPIMDAIIATTSRLMQLSLASDAPPTFLLDADRLRGRGNPGDFDNRWMTFPQDFPSARFLMAHRIQTVILVRASAGQPQDDLAHVLLRWQEAGVGIQSYCVDQPGRPVGITVSRPSSFRAMWQRTLALIGLRRQSAGGFGSIIPQPTSGSGPRFA